MDTKDLRNALLGASQGATMSWGDEANGAIDALLDAYSRGNLGSLSKDYQRNRDIYRRMNERAMEESPKAYIAGSAAGSMLPGMATGGALDPVKVGLITGGIQGLGGSEGSALHQIGDTAEGASLGGIFGSILKGPVRDTEESMKDAALSGARSKIDELGERLRAVSKGIKEDLGSNKTMLEGYEGNLASKGKALENAMRRKDIMDAGLKALTKGAEMNQVLPEGVTRLPSRTKDASKVFGWLMSQDEPHKSEMMAQFHKLMEEIGDNNATISKLKEAMDAVTNDANATREARRHLVDELGHTASRQMGVNSARLAASEGYDSLLNSLGKLGPREAGALKDFASSGQNIDLMKTGANMGLPASTDLLRNLLKEKETED